VYVWLIEETANGATGWSAWVEREKGEVVETAVLWDLTREELVLGGFVPKVRRCVRVLGQ